MPKVNYKNALDKDGAIVEEYWEIRQKYQNEIESGEISNEGLEYIIASFMDIGDSEKSRIWNCIETIYFKILNFKYNTDANTSSKAINELMIHDILSSIYYLKTSKLFSFEYLDYIKDGTIGFLNIPEICKDAYEWIRTHSEYFSFKVKPYEERDEEINIEHLLDLGYHLNNLKKWNVSEEEINNSLKSFWEE